MLWILRLGLYEIEFLRIPQHATLHQAVKLCHKFGKTSAGSYVNGILRSFLRRPPELPQGSSETAMAVRFSHPVWLVRRYLERYGIELSERFLHRNNQPPLSFLWVNTFRTNLKDFCKKLEIDGIKYKLHTKLPNCLILDASNFVQDPLYKSGHCFFMDPASQGIVYLRELEKFKILGDFCCAPGGKSFLLASQKKSTAKLFCCDFSLARLAEARRRSKQYNDPDLSFVNIDLRETLPFHSVFDFVLLDVPCSGLGTLRTHPDIRWRVRESDLDSHHAMQVILLENGFSALKEGGELIYSTCSTEPEENELVVEEFLASAKGASLLGNFHRTFPEFDVGEGFFAARIRKN